MAFNLETDFRPWENAEQDVFILGAGFSIAAHEAYPSTDQLGTKALRKVRERNRLGLNLDRLPENFKNSQFEIWLAQISEDQPYLSTSENLRNRAIFLELTYAIREVILEAENNTKRVLPEWLSQFRDICRYRHSQILTLNYDTLVDATAGNYEISYGSIQLDVLKLHGSISKWWVSTDPTGGTIQEIPLTDPDGRLITPRGLEPFIIPPISVKSEFYRNPKVRELWTAAYDALVGADRVLIIGYSFPSADSSIAGLIQNSLSRKMPRKEVDVEVIDLEPKFVGSQLDRIGIPHAVLFSGNSAVENFVDSYIEEAANYVFNKIREKLTEQHFSAGQIFVQAERRRGGGYASIFRLESEPYSGTLTIKINEYVDYTPDNSGHDRQFREFAELIKSEELNSIVVDRDGRISRIVDCHLLYSNKDYCTLRLVALGPI